MWLALLVAATSAQQSSRDRWIASVLSRNAVEKKFAQAGCVAWIGESSNVYRSARSVRSSNPELALVLFLQGETERAQRFGVFDVVLNLGLRAKERSVLKMRALAVGVRLFERVILLDSHNTLVCGSLEKALPLGRVDLLYEPNTVLALNNRTKFSRVRSILGGDIKFGKHALAANVICNQQGYCDDRCTFAQSTNKEISVASLLRPGSLSNFYLKNKNDKVYRKAPTVFLHIPKAGGNSAKKLLVKDLLARHRARPARSLHISTRLDWDSEYISEPEKKKSTVLYGAFSFGACGSHPLKPCAYYVIFRDPIARLISEYKYCRSTVNFTDQCCGGRRGIGRMRAEASSLVEWAQEKGNFMLEHLLGFSSADWTEMHAAPSRSWHRRDPETRITPLETRRIREGPANQADLYIVLASLRSWFAVIGILEHYEISIALISFALTGSIMPSRQAASVHTHNQHTSVLLDPETQSQVEAALSLDIALYREVTELFTLQVKDFTEERGLSFT